MFNTLSSLTEIYFSDTKLSKCFQMAADWINDNNAENNIRGLITERDSEYGDWYVSILLFEKPGVTE
jgi:hypothetical protein